MVDAFVAAFESPDPANEGVTSSMTALQVLEQALAALQGDAALQDDPLTKATLLEAMGSSMSALGAHQQAITAHQLSCDLRRTRLGSEHPDMLTSMNDLASAYASAGRLDRALPIYEETLKLMKAKLGPDHPSTLTSMNNLAGGYEAAGRLAEALPLYQEILRCGIRIELVRAQPGGVLGPVRQTAGRLGGDPQPAGQSAAVSKGSGLAWEGRYGHNQRFPLILPIAFPCRILPHAEADIASEAERSAPQTKRVAGGDCAMKLGEEGRRTWGI